MHLAHRMTPPTSARFGAARRALGATALVSSVLLACSSSSDGGATPSPTELFSSSIDNVTVEIDYQRGAAPFTGKAGRVADVWQIARDNVARIFSKKKVALPSTLDGMEELTDVTAKSFTSDAILDIAKKHRAAPSSASTATFYLVFLDGLYDDGSGPQDDILGVSIGDSGVVAIFKPVVGGAESALPGVSAFVEQTTIVHELGHAVGLVADGIPTTTTHHDEAHAHHCTNERCAMNWANERGASVVAFARQLSTTGSTILIDDACLADIDAITK